MTKSQAAQLAVLSDEMRAEVVILDRPMPRAKARQGGFRVAKGAPGSLVIEPNGNVYRLGKAERRGGGYYDHVMVTVPLPDTYTHSEPGVR